MKKILVVLLILSVAWGVFAQDGSWRVSGNVELGTKLDFDPTPWDDEKDPASVGGATYNSWDAPRGRFALIYGTYVNDGSLSAGLKFNTRGEGEENNPFFTYNGENFSFSTDLYGTAFLVAGRGELNSANDLIHRLWGNYKFVNGLVFVQAAYKAEEEEFWISDTTAGSGHITVFGGSSRNTDITNHHNFFGTPSTFTYNDGGNYLLGDIRLESISFGVMFPNLLGGRYMYYTGYGGGDPSPRQAYMGANPSTATKNANGEWEGGLGDGVLKNTIIGVKFAMAPIEFAGQFRVRHSGAYIGAKFSTGPVTVGASFSGVMNPEKNASGAYKENKFFKVGGDLNFNGGVFDAGVKASLERSSDPADAKNFLQLVRIQPRFSYKVIPSHLCFALNAGVYFAKFSLAGADPWSDMTWAVQPELFWTFLGTGARNGYGWAGPFYQGGPTGLIARYRVVSQGDVDRPRGGFAGGSTPVGDGGWMAVNAFDIIFQFNF